MPKKASVELIENFLVVWDPEEGSDLYRNGFYGKPLGIAKPKIPEFNVPLILDLMEGLYLLEKGKITVFEDSEKKKVGIRKLSRLANQLYE
jgi:tRNA-intron endonuclease